MDTRTKLLATLFLALLACRPDPSTTTPVTTDPFGRPGTGATTQCSGWFPDWISVFPPPATAQSFQLSQGYPLGIPVVEQVDGESKIVRWDPPAPATGRPWQAFDFRIAAQRMQYLDALKNYALEGMPEVDFVAERNAVRKWYHVPMMTTSPFSRREPYHGTTKERDLRANEHTWINDPATPGPANDVDAFAIGYYDSLGGYTIGQVFRDPDPALSDPTRAQFIDGAFVFKLLFAEHDPSKIDAATYPLDGAPEWEVQDVEATTATSEVKKKIRLLQVDIALRDARSTQTGWVFATYVYDETLVAESNPWRRLTPVGIQWGNDPDVTGPGVGTLDESWLNPALPAVFRRQVGASTVPAGGLDGRLNGPVDNPRSSCISCHSTAQVVIGVAPPQPPAAFQGTSMVAPSSCTSAQRMHWFRNVMTGSPFGTTNFCTPTVTASPPLQAVDYSLQLKEGLESSLYFKNPNPCAATIESTVALQPGSEGARARGAGMERAAAPRVKRVPVDPKAFENQRSLDAVRERR